MRFAAKRLCETSFYLQRGMKKEPRPEATPAGFDNRSRGLGAPAGVTPTNMAAKTSAVCPVSDSRRMKTP